MSANTFVLNIKVNGKSAKVLISENHVAFLELRKVVNSARSGESCNLTEVAPNLTGWMTKEKITPDQIILAGEFEIKEGVYTLFEGYTLKQWANVGNVIQPDEKISQALSLAVGQYNSAVRVKNPLADKLHTLPTNPAVQFISPRGRKAGNGSGKSDKNQKTSTFDLTFSDNEEESK